MPDLLEWPEYLPGMGWLPAYWGVDDQRWAQPFGRLPDLLVVHSASMGNWPAEYLHNPAGGIVAAAHVSFYEGRTNKLRPGTVPPDGQMCFVQQVSLHREAPGAGGSVCQGHGGVNRRAYHLELPAHPPDTALLREQFRSAVLLLVGCVPSVVYWTTHKEIDPKHKRDPVPTAGFTPRWMDGLGLEWAPREG